MRMWESGFPEPSILGQLPSQEVPCSICNFPGCISGVHKTHPNVVGAGAVANLSVCGLTTGGTFHSAEQYFYSSP